MLAYDYPLLGAFWTVFWIFIWVAWIILLFRVFVDIFRSHDMGGVAKGLWAIFVILVPFLGVFVYLIARGGKMQERDIENARAQEQQFQGYVREVAGSGDVADQLTKLSQLRDQGVISEAEFTAQKAKLLA
jgi:hypothetical protein